MRVRVATQPAPGASANEDAVFVASNIVGVLDGVTAPAGVDTGCVHTAAWYVDQLAHTLADTVRADPAVGLADLLAAAIAAVRDQHGGPCDLDHPGTHAATVCLARHAADGQLDYLLLCDTRLVLDYGTTFEILADPRFTAAVAPLRRAAFTTPADIGTAEHQHRLHQTTLARQQLVNQPHGFWIAAADPAAAHHAITGSAPTSGIGAVHRAALLTDGAADAVERYCLFDWRQLLDIADTKGPDEIIHRVRAAEDTDATGVHQPRYKRHDDATIALCTFERRSA